MFEVLDGCGKQELVPCSVEAAQAEPCEAENVFDLTKERASPPLPRNDDDLSIGAVKNMFDRAVYLVKRIDRCDFRAQLTF